MITKVQNWGNSQGLRLNRQILDEAHIAVGDEVDVSVRDAAIVIMPAIRVRGARDLKELVARIPKNYKVEEVAWGGPAGREVW